MSDPFGVLVAVAVLGFLGYTGLHSRRANGVRRLLRLFQPQRQRMPRWKRQLVYLRSGGRCSYCGVRVTYRWRGLPDSLEVDHRVPWSWGGSDGIGNLAASCKACNRRKSARFRT